MSYLESKAIITVLPPADLRDVLDMLGLEEGA